MLTYIDKKVKEIAVKKYGDIFTDEEIEFARVVAFQTIDEAVRSVFPKKAKFDKDDTFEWAFLECLYYIKEENEEKAANS